MEVRTYGTDNSDLLLGHKACPFRKEDNAVLPVAIELSSNVFGAMQPMPKRYCCDGQNISPPLQWTLTPRTTKESMLICEDPNAPLDYPFIHWIIYGITPDIESLPEGIPHGTNCAIPRGAKQGENSRKEFGYCGPCPPRGSGPHCYHFQLFALDRETGMEEISDRDSLLKLIFNHIVGFSDLIATYERK